MLEIRKINNGFFLVNGEYVTSNFNKALQIANGSRAIKGLGIESKKISFEKYIRYKFIGFCKCLKFGFNKAFEILEDLM